MKTLALSLATLLLTVAPAAFAAAPAGYGVVSRAPARVVVVKKPVRYAKPAPAQREINRLERRIDTLERELARTRRYGGRASLVKQRRLRAEIAETKRDLREIRTARYARRGPNARRDDWRRR